MKKLLLILIIPLLFSCSENTSSSKKSKILNTCLIGSDFCSPNCENPNMIWQFYSDGKFNFTSTLFGGNNSQGNWKDLGGDTIQINYIKNNSGYDVPSQIISMPNCSILKVGNSLFKK